MARFVFTSGCFPFSLLLDFNRALLARCDTLNEAALLQSSPGWSRRSQAGPGWSRRAPEPLAVTCRRDFAHLSVARTIALGVPNNDPSLLFLNVFFSSFFPSHFPPLRVPRDWRRVTGLALHWKQFLSAAAAAAARAGTVRSWLAGQVLRRELIAPPLPSVGRAAVRRPRNAMQRGGPVGGG